MLEPLRPIRLGESFDMVDGFDNDGELDVVDEVYVEDMFDVFVDSRIDVDCGGV